MDGVIVAWERRWLARSRKRARVSGAQRAHIVRYGRAGRAVEHSTVRQRQEVALLDARLGRVQVDRTDVERLRL